MLGQILWHIREPAISATEYKILFKNATKTKQYHMGEIMSLNAGEI